MSQRTREKEWRYLSPVEKIPQGRLRRGLYDDVLKEFIDSGLKYAEMKDIGKHPATVAQILRKRVKAKRIENIAVSLRSKKVYLERLG